MLKKLLIVTFFSLLYFFALPIYAENTNFTTSHFSGSGNCQMCHDNLRDTNGDDVSIVRDWGASMMANAAKDPLWRAKVATELERNSHLSSTINDKCSKCHAPMANYELTKVQADDIKILGPGSITDPSHSLYDAGMNGVSCTVCHQITDAPELGTLSGFSGNYKINDSKIIYGQFSNIFAQPMINASGYQPVYSQHISGSEVCATCHNLKTPFVDSEGNILSGTADSEFPEQMPYTEWQHSIFDDAGSNPKSCQDCHMPKTTAPVSNRPRWIAAKDGFAKHHLVGANTVMLTMLRDNAAQLEVTSPNLDLGIDRARAMLKSAATIDIVDASVTNGVLSARIKVDNHSGHKAPTSYPSRRMWINFKVTDSSNNIIFESGRIKADGSIVEADNDWNPSVFEPHYDLIDAEDQVQIYETIMGNSDDEITHTLLRASQYLKDNRLTPKGFDKFAVPGDVAVHGLAFSDPDFNLGSDELTYQFPVNVSGELTVSATLNFQTLAYGFVQDLYSDAHLGEVQTFKTLYDAQTLKHELVDSIQTVVISDAGGVPAAVMPTVSITASPVTIEQGQSSVLSWESSDASSCTASGFWSDPLALSGSVTKYPTVTSTYTITCTGNEDSVSDSVVVTVTDPPPAVPTVSITASPVTIERGQSTVLSWTATDTTNCTAPAIVSGGLALNGSATVTPDVTSTYTISCDGGTVSDSVVVTVIEPPPVITQPTLTLTTSSSSVRRGSSVTLSWSSTDAQQCSASGDWTGSKPVSGTESIVINNSVVFTLTCDGTNGIASDSVSVNAFGRWGRR